MTELNTKIEITTLPYLIDNNIEDFKHYNVPMAEQTLDVFLHTRTNNLFFVGKQCSVALDYTDSDQSVRNNILDKDKIKLSYAHAEKLFSIVINSLGNNLNVVGQTRLDTGLNENLETDANLLINKENVQSNKYKVSPNGLTIISEEGYMDLIIDSHKPEAKAFRRKLIDIAVEIRQTGSYGISKPSNMDLSELSRRLDSMEKFIQIQTTNGTTQNTTMEKLIELVDNRNKLGEKIENIVNRTLGSSAYWLKNTFCVKDKSAAASKYWDERTTVWEALCNIVTYTKSLSSQITGHNKDIKELAKTNLEIRKSLRRANEEIVLLRTQFDDQLIANVLLLREEVANLEKRLD